MTDLDAFAGLTLDGQRVLVVGAGAGIGAAAARLLSRRGAEVICADRHADDARAVAAGIRGEGTHLDVTDQGEVQEVIRGVLAEGPLHALVNCAGATGRTGVRSEDVPVGDFDRVWDINTRGAFLLAQAVLPHMVDQGYGRILHVASIAGKEGNAGMVSYSASKAGLIGMVKAMGKEYAQTGVTINSLAPAVIRTAMVAEMPEEQVAYMTEKIPMNRCGTLDEVAEAICWAVSPAASFTTGFVYDLSGGRAVY
ncbi:MAG: SDR family NAD(P)-dependent oxidoreductase [Microbacteriaceae bacterium]|uniref:SDR family NAD(P)-dependent oxidoreductase n=1 Tax=Microbacterium sp. JB110 TaxID=2024477 RepID=UPI000B357400|nr:SDR family NAD(P)-dependent oxidoreductase [Microbacterium sp. JB110]RCS58878.1 SDR family NAD(P)-dependent oxidoreductase [Microbacterium sp. JB110]